MNQKGFIKTKTIILIMLILILGAAGYFILINKQSLSAEMAERECKRIEGGWVLAINEGYGCAKRFSDGGKQCSSGSDCSSGLCKIGTANLVNPPPQENNQDSYTGTCRETFFGWPPFDTPKPEPGEASLKNGKIMEDRRSEPGVIY